MPPRWLCLIIVLFWLACNGWLFWHFERDGAWLPIDTLRGEVVATPEDPNKS